MFEFAKKGKAQVFQKTSLKWKLQITVNGKVIFLQNDEAVLELGSGDFLAQLCKHNKNYS